MDAEIGLAAECLGGYNLLSVFMISIVFAVTGSFQMKFQKNEKFYSFAKKSLECILFLLFIAFCFSMADVMSASPTTAFNPNNATIRFLGIMLNLEDMFMHFITIAVYAVIGIIVGAALFCFIPLPQDGYWEKMLFWEIPGIKNIWKKTGKRALTEKEALKLLEEWFESHSLKDDKKRHRINGKNISPRDIIQATRDNTDLGRDIINSVIGLTARGLDISEMLK